MVQPASFAFRLGPVLLGTTVLTLAGIALPAVELHAQEVRTTVPATVRILADDIETADYTAGDLPSGQSAITARVQILLDRSGISPGVVDGWRGGMSESAIKAFQRRAGLPMDGRMSPVVWQLLQPFASEPMTQNYTIVEQDGFGLVDNIPSDYGEKAKMSSQGYTSIAEKLAERFHIDERFLIALNPGVEFVPGATIRATVPARPIRAKVSRIIVDKATRRVAAYDANGRMVADYPATVGSDQTPSPHGTHVVDAVALDPTYTYNPSKNFKQGDNDRVLVVPPGPNGPVGNVWIDLSKPTYGIHGTATPSQLFVNQSNGCVRLTNWDARELASMVQSGKTVVEFLDPGVSIADVTGVSTPAATSSVAVAATVTSISATRPTPRPRLFAQPAAQEPAPGIGTTTDAPLPTQPAMDAPVATVPLAPVDPLAAAIADAIGPSGAVVEIAPQTDDPRQNSAVVSPAGSLPTPPTTEVAAPQSALAPTAPPRRRAVTETQPVPAASIGVSILPAVTTGAN